MGLQQYAEMREDDLNDDHRALCCAVSPTGECLAVGGTYAGDSRGLLVCYRVRSKMAITLQCIVDDESESESGMGALRGVWR